MDRSSVVRSATLAAAPHTDNVHAAAVAKAALARTQGQRLSCNTGIQTLLPWVGQFVALAYFWKIGRNLFGICRTISAIAVP